MTRLGSVFFNIMLTVLVYGLIYLSGMKVNAYHFTFTYFSIPYVLLCLLMSLFAVVRWFLSHESELLQEALTFFINFVIALALTIPAVIYGAQLKGGPLEVLRMLG